ncbi:MAG: hypothetical protein J1E06_04150 [Acutalibacter sp.]|nr:hypothetical protein [Acutalibacter sp.]
MAVAEFGSTVKEAQTFSVPDVPVVVPLFEVDPAKADMLNVKQIAAARTAEIILFAIFICISPLLKKVIIPVLHQPQYRLPAFLSEKGLG